MRQDNLDFNHPIYVWISAHLLTMGIRVEIEPACFSALMDGTPKTPLQQVHPPISEYVCKLVTMAGLTTSLESAQLPRLAAVMGHMHMKPIINVLFPLTALALQTLSVSTVCPLALSMPV